MKYRIVKNGLGWYAVQVYSNPTPFVDSQFLRRINGKIIYDNIRNASWLETSEEARILFIDYMEQIKREKSLEKLTIIEELGEL
jgi:hypothetical protein